MDPLIQDTLRKIKDGHIQPDPQWKFQAQNSAWWIITILTILFAGIATALATHLLLDLDWDAYSRSAFSRSEVLFSTLPLAWILVFASFLIFSYFNIRHTKHGYQYATWILFSACFIFSVGIGFLLALMDIDQPVNQAFSNTIPQYESFWTYASPTLTKQWSNPQKGLLGGTILSINNDMFILRDFQKQTWNVILTPKTVFITPLDHAEAIRPTSKVRIIGVIKNPSTFEAEEIRPWKKSRFKDFKEQEDESEREERETVKEE